MRPRPPDAARAAACWPAPPSAGASLALPGALRSALAQTPLTMGVIYVGPRGDFGYNQAQAAGRRGDQEAARREGASRKRTCPRPPPCRRPWRP